MVPLKHILTIQLRLDNRRGTKYRTSIYKRDLTTTKQKSGGGGGGGISFEMSEGKYLKKKKILINKFEEIHF